MVTIIDYGIGNLGSVVKAFKYLEIPVKLTDSKKQIKRAEAVVLPGVGAFGEGMRNLRKNNLDQVIYEIIKKGVPFLGICLGFQLLFTTSEEDKGVKGLDIFSGQVKKFDKNKVNKIPHMGWNQVKLRKQDPLFKEFTEDHNFYFVHSYYVKPENDEIVLGQTGYGRQNFVSVIRSNNIWGIQCHPEKSSKIGLKVLNNFYKEIIRGDNNWK
ncbi:MAG: imidazole glycerol phosphate synthase subunit HisH [Halanaerobiaceae bacterium]